MNGNLVALQPNSSQHFSESDLIIKYEVEKSSTNSPSFIVFHYYLEGDVDVAHYTTKNAYFNAEITVLQSSCVFFEGDFFKTMIVKGDGSCFYRAVAPHVMSFCLHNVTGKKPGIRPTSFEVVNDLKELIFQNTMNTPKSV